jgi:uncharacterized protein YndB with AHSA1/START domain
MAEKNESKEFIITRIFNAPRQLVWDAYTQEKHMLQWWGPKGTKMIIGKMDLRPQGIFHYGLQMPDGNTMWGKFVFREIVPIEKLVFVVSFSDKDGGFTRHPMAPTWPLETLSSTTFEDMGDKTKVIVTWKAINAPEDECNLFDASHESMSFGMEGSFEQLDAYLKTIS